MPDERALEDVELSVPDTYERTYHARPSEELKYEHQRGIDSVHIFNEEHADTVEYIVAAMTDGEMEIEEAESLTTAVETAQQWLKEQREQRGEAVADALTGALAPASE